MATQISLLPENLQHLLSKLTEDPEIQRDVGKIATKGKACVASYKAMISVEGNAVIIQKQLLANAESASDVNVKKMGSLLLTINGKLVTIRQDVMAMQGDVHMNIEACRSRKRRHEADINAKACSISVLEGDIRSADAAIKVLDSQIEEFERAAKEMDQRVRDINNAETDKRVAGGVGIASSVLGVVFAPFTFGTSLVLTGVGIASAVSNITSADEGVREAARLRTRAKERRNEASDMKNKRSDLKKKKVTIKSDITSLRSACESLDEATRNLQEMTNGLSSFISGIDSVLAVFQDMETTFKECKMQTQSFQIIQNAFKKHADRPALEEIGQKYLNQLKSKWDSMEAILTQNGAKAIRKAKRKRCYYE